MLTQDLILSFQRGDKIFPKYLSFDEANINVTAQAIELAKQSVGIRQGEVSSALLDILNDHFSPKIGQGLSSLILKQCKFNEADRKGIELRREELFNQSAKIWQNGFKDDPPNFHTISDVFAKKLKLPQIDESNTIEEFLYADIPQYRKLISFTPKSSNEIINLYNIAQVQGILVKALSCRIEIKKATNLVFRELLFRIHRENLICSQAKHETSSSILEIVGPEDGLENARSYGSEFSKIFPAILGIKEKWSFTALISDRKKLKKYKLSLSNSLNYQPTIKETGVWQKNEISAFIERWNEKNKVTAKASPAKEYFTNDSHCRVPDIVFVGEGCSPKQKIYLEWLRYVPADFNSVLSDSVKFIPKNYIFAVKGNPANEQTIQNSTGANVLFFKTTISATRVRELLKSLQNNSPILM